MCIPQMYVKFNRYWKIMSSSQLSHHNCIIKGQRQGSRIPFTRLDKVIYWNFHLSDPWNVHAVWDETVFIEANRSSSRPEEQQRRSHDTLFGTTNIGVAAGKFWQLGTFTVSSRPQMSSSPAHPVSSSISLSLSHMWKELAKP